MQLYLSFIDDMNNLFNTEIKSNCRFSVLKNREKNLALDFGLTLISKIIFFKFNNIVNSSTAGKYNIFKQLSKTIEFNS